MKMIQTKEIGFFNTPERLSRIAKFTMQLKVQSVEGQNSVTFVASEPICLDMDALQSINNVIEKEIEKYEEHSLFMLNRQLTKHCRSLLTYCRVYFEDERDFDIHAKDNEVLRLAPGGVVVHSLFNGG
jgi:hypothetical protein